MAALLRIRWMKIPIFLLCLLPLLDLVRRALSGGLGPNPIEFITHKTGDWTLIFLVLTLAISPARKLLRQPDLIRLQDAGSFRVLLWIPALLHLDRVGQVFRLDGDAA